MEEHGTLMEYLEMTPKDVGELDVLVKELHEIMSDDKRATTSIVETYKAFFETVKDLDRPKLIFVLFKNYHLSQIFYSVLVKICGEETAEQLICQALGASTKNNQEQDGEDAQTDGRD